MIQLRTVLKVADNSGAKVVHCISPGAGYRKRYARIGDVVTVAVRTAMPTGLVKAGEVVKAVVVRTTKEIRRKNGVYIRFSDNAVVIIDPKSKEPRASRIFGPIPRELRKMGFAKIISLAPEVL